jgi:transposase
MGRALTISTREEIMRLFVSGQNAYSISKALNLSYSTVNGLCKRIKEGGVAFLPARYGDCGRRPAREQNPLYQKLLDMRREHPEWGAEYLLVQMSKFGPPLPSPRTLQRWFRKEGFSCLRGRAPKTVKVWSSKVHDIWQVDAKEQVSLPGGEEVCWLSVTDEKSGALLGAVLFPPQPHMSSAVEGDNGRSQTLAAPMGPAWGHEV